MSAELRCAVWVGMALGLRNAIFMGLTNPVVAATQFTAFVGMSNLATSPMFHVSGLFAGVIMSNSVIGVVQEIRAKRTLDQLEVVNTPTVNAVRDGQDVELSPGEIVADDDRCNHG